MIRLSVFSLIALFFLANSWGNNENKSAKKEVISSNPLLQTSDLPFQAIPFDKIKDADFQPAIEEGMKQKLEEIQIIADNPDSPTFNNTLVPMEKSGQLLTRANNAFHVLTGANTNPELQKVQQVEAPKLAANDDAIYLNPKLFKRVVTIYDQRDKLNLDPESKKLVEYYYQKFLLAGAKLSDADKDKLKKLNEESASLSAQFTTKLLAATKDGALVVADSSALQGISAGKKDAAEQGAKQNKLDGKWLISLQNTTQQPDLSSL
jgi:peptidyl-dipeptidase Dcp